MGKLFVGPRKADGGHVGVGGGVTCGFELQAKCPVGGFHAEGIGLVNPIIWVIVGSSGLSSADMQHLDKALAGLCFFAGMCLSLKSNRSIPAIH